MTSDHCPHNNTPVSTLSRLSTPNQQHGRPSESMAGAQGRGITDALAAVARADAPSIAGVCACCVSLLMKQSNPNLSCAIRLAWQMFLPAIVTPLTVDGKLDVPSLQRLCKHFFDQGCAGLYVRITPCNGRCKARAPVLPSTTQHARGPKPTVWCALAGVLFTASRSTT